MGEVSSDRAGTTEPADDALHVAVAWGFVRGLA
jgi:hypothetical protein